MVRRFLARVLLALVPVMASLWICPEASAQPRPLPTVLAVYWSSEEFPSTPILDGAIREVFASHPEEPIDFYAEYLESDRFPDETATLAFRDYIRLKFRGRHIDVVLAIADPAVEFVLRYRAELFPDAAIVFSMATVPPPGMTTGVDATGVVGALADVETMQLALTVHPATRRVFVVAQAPAAGYVDRVRASLATVATAADLIFFSDMPLPRLLEAVRAVPPGSLILYLRYSQEDPGHVLFPHEIARLVAEAAQAPVYGITDTYIGTGIVGGVVRSTRLVGTRVGEKAVQILDGTRAQDIPVEQIALTPMFDWRQVQRWGIDEALLPRGSNLRFREPSDWELYRWYIIGALALLAAQGIMIGALVFQRSRRREVEARQSAILRAVPDMMFLQTRGGEYIDYHAPHPQKLLMKPSEFIGRHMRDVLPPDLAALFEKCFAGLTPGQPPAIVEYTLPMPDGRQHFEARIVPCRGDYVLSMVQDITERKRAEAALQDGRERYARATMAGRVGVWDWDVHGDEVYVDPSLKAILGYAPDEIGKFTDEWQRLIHPDDMELLKSRAYEHLEGNAPFEAEHRLLHRDGGVRWFLTRGSAVHQNGQAVRVIGTCTDITERKVAEYALQEAQADLHRVSRLTALGEFATSISHEIRQPLTAIISNARTCMRWLSGSAPDMNEVTAALQDVVDAGLRADDMIQRNRELFRHHTVEMAPLDVAAVITETAAVARARIEVSEVTLTVSQGTTLPNVIGDRVELQQVLLNLIANSIDAMEGLDPPLKRIDVSTSLEADGKVRVSVKDSGVGLAGVDVEQMFELSYTTKAGGTGVGLSISRSIVEAHGGRIWAEQNADGGATFCFTIPVDAAVVT